MLKKINKSYFNSYFKSPWDDQENIFNKKRKNDFFQGFNFDFNKDSNFNFNNKNILLIVFAAIVLWFFSGIYQVKEGEEGIVMRFGAFVRKSTPGLNYLAPYPFEEVFIEKVNQSRRVEIGYRSSFNKTQGKNNLNESIMLTGDENIVELNCDIMWHINNLESFVLNVYNPESTIRAVSESAIREVVGRTPISSILSNQKQEIANEIEKLIQKTLDDYKIGIQVEQVQLLKAEPPSEVIDSYRDVQTAKADKEREMNQAQAYRNDNLPRAKGEAQKLIQEAEGYKQEVVSRAEGEVKRFDSVYKEYSLNKEVTKNRLYLEAAEEILKNNQKVITNGVFPHMKIDGNKGSEKSSEN